MNAYQVYEQAVKPLSTQDKLTLARLILDDVVPDVSAIDTPHTASGFDRLKSILPQIERITLTDQGLAKVALADPI